MFLLKLRDFFRNPANLSAFTFHNVSIKTTFLVCFRVFIQLFTFHNVSIKTVLLYSQKEGDTALHSTMFLLKLTAPVDDFGNPVFPLHSTMFLLKRMSR